MMNIIETAWICAYYACLFFSCCYGLHFVLMVYYYWRYRSNPPETKGKFAILPQVTIQLPLYNERYVVERLIDAVAAIEYPREKLEIQVLDDSTDDTIQIVSRKVAYWKSRGIDIHHIHRTNRRGYKAGALEEGLKRAKGEFVAIFDADFVPDPDFLNRSIHHFTDSKVGMVQGRWGHLNEEMSLLTRAQAMFLDAHFIVEQSGRCAAGLFFNFNGTAGMWRKAAINSSGGWEHDTLTEDLDLSYRAQLAGWKFVFLKDLVVPAELPVDMNGWKSQQYRWAKGSAQTFRKLIARLWNSKQSLLVKLEGTIHLTAYLNCLVIVGLVLLLDPDMLAARNMTGTQLLMIDLPIFLLTFGAGSLFYVTSGVAAGKTWGDRILLFFAVLALSPALALNNVRAVLQGLTGHQSEFTRTPKHGTVKSSRKWVRKEYRGFGGMLPYIEGCFALYFLWMLGKCMFSGLWLNVFFMSLPTFGFIYVCSQSLLLGRPLIKIRRSIGAGRRRTIPEAEVEEVSA